MGDETALDGGADLAAFLARHTPVATDEAVWLGGAIRLQISSYVSREAPPSAMSRQRVLSSSVAMTC